MGREIRRVPPDWQHPRDARGEYIPTFDQDYDSAAQEWIDTLMQWEAGDNPDRAIYETEKGCRCYYWAWNGDPPDPASYRHRAWTAEEATAYQYYENTSEGTPLSPVLPDAETLIAWLVAHAGFSEDGARRLLQWGSMPTMMVQVTPTGYSVIDQRR